jgi:hypothetical protein
MQPEDLNKIDEGIRTLIQAFNSLQEKSKTDDGKPGIFTTCSCDGHYADGKGFKNSVTVSAYVMDENLRAKLLDAASKSGFSVFRDGNRVDLFLPVTISFPEAKSRLGQLAAAIGTMEL